MAPLCCCAASLTAVVATILCLQIQTSIAKNPHAQDCGASSCGKIQNISYPFRLKGQADICGDPRYELHCENNVTVLYLLSGKYQVLHIDYNMYKIRLRDAGVEEDNCASIPRYFLHRQNFSAISPDLSNFPRTLGFSLMQGIIPDPQIAYYNCSNPVTNDSRYVDTGECLGDDLTGSGWHLYAIVDPSLNFSARDVKVGCRLKISSLAPPDYQYTNHVSYKDIHNLVLTEFELWWNRIVCEDKCGKVGGCGFIPSTGQVECFPASACSYGSLWSHGFLSIDQCGLWLKIVGLTGAYLYDIFNGLVSRIRYPVSNEYLPHPLVSEGAASIGRYVLPSYIVVRTLFGYCFLVALLIYQWRKRHKSMYGNIETFLQDYNLMPIRYSYREVKKMTRGFQDKLGEGGYGSVYRGKLRSGAFVAVKMLGKAKSNGQDFISEVATIGRIHHVNVVRLIGFCVEGSKRALVYEFMLNGSLDKYIFRKERSISLSYDKIYEISLAVARGIAYLHQGCDMQILHFDIKPHNILLDENSFLRFQILDLQGFIQ